MTRIAFFDVDKTLLGINAGVRWLKFEHKAGRLTLGQGVRAATALLRYSFGATDIEDTMRYAMRQQTGMSADLIRQRTIDFMHEAVIPAIREDAMDRFHAHQEDGMQCVLLSTSTHFLCEALGEHIGADGVIATELEIGSDGLLTGEPVEPLTYGPGKVIRAQVYCDRVGAVMEDSIFYTDSFSDLPMLEAVKYPVVVCPDRRLRAFAKRRGWPIEDWGK